MNNWMNEFLNRCLDAVPQGKYRDRTEKELQDHLLALSQGLEEAGHPSEEAHALALSRMGDPAELSRRYVQEWRRRTLGQRCLIGLELLTVGSIMVVMAYLYAINTSNFGKSWVADWSFVAIPAVGLLLVSFLVKGWTLARLSSWVITVIQLPPIFLWFVCHSTFEMSGVMVPMLVGLGLHLLFFTWGRFNYHIAIRFQEEDAFLKTHSA